MKIKTLIGINGYTLMVSHSSGQLYHLNIINPKNVVSTFEGIYPNLGNAISRGKSVIKNMRHSKYA